MLGLNLEHGLDEESVVDDEVAGIQMFQFDEPRRPEGLVPLRRGTLKVGVVAWYRVRSHGYHVIVSQSWINRLIQKLQNDLNVYARPG